jgi:hypothetical protein
MLRILVLFILVVSGKVPALSQATPKYQLRFQYADSAGSIKDTLVSRIKLAYWSKQSNFPPYLKWKGQAFAVLKSAIDGIGLFTDSTTTYNTGDFVAYAFVKRASAGRFDLDYIETNPASFINDHSEPNLDIELTGQGIILKANRPIAALTELTISYAALIALFPGDITAERTIKYW